MSLQLAWNNEQDELIIEDSLIARLEGLLQLAGEQEQINSGEVALTFVSEEEIHRLNKEFRGIDRPTDVLSFPMMEMGEEEMEIVYDDLEEEMEGFEEAEPLGDIVISIPRAIAQSKEYGHSTEREIGFLFVHGFLHLIGYDHENEADEKEMFGKQEEILQKAGLTR